MNSVSQLDNFLQNSDLVDGVNCSQTNRELGFLKFQLGQFLLLRSKMSTKMIHVELSNWYNAVSSNCNRVTVNRCRSEFT